METEEQLLIKVRPAKGAKLVKTWMSKGTTIEEANKIVCEHLDAPEGAFLSLNGRDPLGEPQQTIGSVIVHGDLLKLVGAYPSASVYSHISALPLRLRPGTQSHHRSSSARTSGRSSCHCTFVRRRRCSLPQLLPPTLPNPEDTLPTDRAAQISTVANLAGASLSAAEDALRMNHWDPDKVTTQHSSSPVLLGDAWVSGCEPAPGRCCIESTRGSVC